jgi:hypothetical protein
LTHPTPIGLHPKETAMLRSTALHLLASATAVLFAVAGCDLGKIDTYSDQVLPPATASALDVPPLGQELFHLFEAEKAEAAAAELPAQF